MATAVLEDFHNYLRLEILLSTCGDFAVRQIFRSRYIDLMGIEWEDCSRASKDEFLANIQSTLKETEELPKESIEKGDINDWDLGTIFLVLRTMCPYQESYVAQSDTDTDATKIETENNLVAQLIQVQNCIMHSPGKSICSDDFKLWWKTAAEALEALGVSSEDIEHVGTSEDLLGIEFKNLNDEIISAENLEVATKLGEEGNAALALNKFEIAIELYSKALSLYGLPKIESATLYSNRSWVHLKSLMGVRDTPIPEDEVDLICNLALEDAEKAIELGPTWFQGYFRRGKVHQFKKEWDAAIKSFDQALELNMGCEKILKAKDECRMELTRVRCRDYINPTETLNQINSQEFIDKISSEKGTPHLTPKEVCKHYEKLLKFNKDPREKSEALIFLADRYTHGLDGYPQDYEMAIKLCKEAAEDLGDPEAMYILGSMYQVGNGVAIDLDAAVKLFEKSIQVCLENNYVDISRKEGVTKLHVLGNAQYLLGRCYQEGLGKPVDYSEAANFYSAASENNCGEAAHNLGCLYFKGQGVVENNERATQYWKLAARRGVAMSVQNLAWANLSWNNLDLAQLHFSYALKASPNITSLRKKEFYDILCSLRKWKKAKNEMTSLNDHQGEDKTPLKGANMLNAREEIEGKAALGLPYAKELLASLQNFLEGQFHLDFLECITTNSHLHLDPNEPSILNAKTESLRYLADHYRSSQHPQPLSDSFSSTLKEITTETMKLWSNKESEIDCNARICYASIICNSSEETVNFLILCQRKYPLEIFFPILYSTILGFQLESMEEIALDVIIEALKKFPGDVELLGLKAKLMYKIFSCVKSRTHEDTKLAIPDIVTAFQDFLSVAPSDHRRAPNAYYTLGLLCYPDLEVYPISKTEFLVKLEKYLGLGVEAEKNLLSFFLPPDGNLREKLQTKINKFRSQLLSEGLAGLSMAPQSSTSIIAKPKEMEIQLVPVSLATYIQQTDPNRIDSVLSHRNGIKMIQSVYQSITQGSQSQSQSQPWRISKSKDKKSIRLSFSAKPLNTQYSPSKLAELKEIHLEEMDPLTDRVYKGRVLQNVTIVEDSLFDVYISIESVLMDSNGEVQRCYFMNLDHKDEKVRKLLSFGSRLSIINPYYRLCVGGGCGIRIEDPQSVVFHSTGDEVPLCRFCLAKNPQQRCSKCKRASYCSKQCQIHDYKILRHKLICKRDL